MSVRRVRASTVLGLERLKNVFDVFAEHELDVGVL